MCKQVKKEKKNDQHYYQRGKPQLRHFLNIYFVFLRGGGGGKRFKKKRSCLFY